MLTAAEQETRIGKTSVEAVWAFVQSSIASVEKLVTEAATGGSSRVVKSLPDLIRETLHRHAGQATSTLMLRALGTRVTAASLKEAISQMGDVEVFKDTMATGRGAKPTVYRLIRPSHNAPGEHDAHPEPSNTSGIVTVRQEEPPSLRVVKTPPKKAVSDLRARIPAEG